MLVAAALCPAPPLLVPALTGHSAEAELRTLRAACASAVGRMLATGPDVVAVVGPAPQTRSFGPDTHGTLTAYGVSVAVGDATSPPALPLSLTVGRWLLDQAGRPRRVVRDGRSEDQDGARSHHSYAPAELNLWGVADTSGVVECTALGAEVARSASRVAVLALGEGSARRTPTSPAGYVPGAPLWDEALLHALGSADLEALEALDPARGREVAASGRATWQVLAGAAAGGPRPRGELLHAESPRGVLYPVALWTAASGTVASGTVAS